MAKHGHLYINCERRKGSTGRWTDVFWIYFCSVGNKHYQQDNSVGVTPKTSVCVDEMSPEVGVLTSNPRPVSCFHFAQGTAPCSFSWKITCRLVNWKTKLKQFYFYFSDWAGKSNIRTFWIEVSLFCLSWMSKKQAHVIQTQHEPNKTQSGLSLHSHLWSGQIKPQFTKWKVWILQLSLSHPRQPALSCLAIAEVKVLVRGLISTTYCIPRWTDLSKSWRLRSIPVWFPATFPLMSADLIPVALRYSPCDPYVHTSQNNLFLPPSSLVSFQEYLRPTHTQHALDPITGL